MLAFNYEYCQMEKERIAMIKAGEGYEWTRLLRNSAEKSKIKFEESHNHSSRG